MDGPSLYSHFVNAVTVYGVHLTDMTHSVVTESTTEIRITISSTSWNGTTLKMVN